MKKIEKTAISIRAVLTSYVKAIRYLQGIEKNGEPFTIRDWMRGVREDRPNGWLFISSNADTHASLKPVISMWLSIAIRGLLAMGENRNRRVWIFADELPTLHKLPDLVEILPEARKFGGCYVFGIQSYAQLEDIYGVKPAATLFDVMNTRAFFRSPSKEIAEFAAGEIGEKEILKASEQYSYGADPVRDGVSTGKEKERETLVSYSDIQTLPDLSCYVTLPGPYPAVKLALKYKPRPKIAEGFIPRSLDARVDARLSALLEAREAEGSLARALFTPDAPEPGPADTDSHAGEQPEPAEVTVSPAPVKATQTTKMPAEEPSVRATEPPVLRVTTVPLIKPKAAAAAAAAATASSAGTPAAAAGGTEQELAQQSAEQGQDMLPAGMNEDGVIEDMQAYDAWADEQTQRDMQRREEVNINHSHRHDEQDDVEIGELLMLSFSQVKSAGSAGNYYTDKDNYYVIGSMDERWQGKGAEALGLEGKVDKQVFTELLQGKLPDGSDLTRIQDGVNKHRPGYDLTFSAPKSVSMLAMLGGDKRLIDAHNRAVTVALNGGVPCLHTGKERWRF